MDLEEGLNDESGSRRFEVEEAPEAPPLIVAEVDDPFLEAAPPLP